MSFKRFDTEDIVVSSDSITAPAWSDTVVTLNTFFTSSIQTDGSSGDYYYNIYKDNVALTSSAAIQFSIAHGDLNGSGSVPFNSDVAGYSPSSVIYKQYRNLVLGNEDSNFVFGNISGSHIYVVSVERSRFKEKLLPGSLTLTLSSGGNTVSITDDSNYSNTVTFTDAGRVYELISGSAGVVYTGLESNGYTGDSGSYGKFLPDVGVLILNGHALDNVAVSGGLALGTTMNIDSASYNKDLFYDAISGGSEFTIRSEETISSNYVFVRARNSEFNYSTNPSNITGSGELRHDVMVDTPQAYATTVGLYNDNNDLLAVAKLSRPLLKDFTKEALIRIKLDY